MTSGGRLGDKPELQSYAEHLFFAKRRLGLDSAGLWLRRPPRRPRERGGRRPRARNPGGRGR
eukprot:9080096-Alexandrium_andersonii.AAC.1